MNARNLLDAYADEENPRAMPPFQLLEAAAPRAFAALRAVLDLHAPEEFGEPQTICPECSDGSPVVAWPCDTVPAIEEALKP
jgi:hypothetical protein